MNSPSLIIRFNEIWTPTAIFLQGNTDIETEKLRKIAEKILANIEEGSK